MISGAHNLVAILSPLRAEAGEHATADARGPEGMSILSGPVRTTESWMLEGEAQAIVRTLARTLTTLEEAKCA